ncbi:APC family permease [Neobacillus niacini]|uniref:APC family permease n=1 Tax=Neobacillus niacini TaxID=86668 RepID=UPI002865FA41|nr:APC family permease [Neobacillus niacini]MDR7002643.1 putrescine importer [Neobacillus niacini]
MKEKATLRRSLTLFQVVFLGLAWNNPMVFFNTYGIAAESSKGLLTGAYIIAFMAILFTAASYGKMARAHPIAGSAYTYTQRSMNSETGFIVGWTILLDYLLTPMITCLMSAVFLSAEFPEIPFSFWIITLNIGITIVSLIGINFSANTSRIFVIAQIMFVALFVILTIKSVLGGMGTGTLISAQPFFNPNVSASVLFAGASLLCFSFLGFDSVTTLSEETINPEKTIPKAIFLMMLIMGLIYIGSSYLAQIVFPGFSFKNTDSAALELVKMIGGNLFSSLFITVMIIGNFTSGVSSVTSVSRVLYVMGRDAVIPKKIFGYIHPRFRTPSNSILVVSLVSFLGIVISLDTAITFINFGALIAFTFVNLSVIAHYYVKNHMRSFKETIQYLIFPLIGAGFIMWLWSYLDIHALILGISWVAVGFVYLLILTKCFRQRLRKLHFDDVNYEPMIVGCEEMRISVDS